MQPFQLFMLKEHIKNLQNEITEYKKSMDDDFAFEEENGGKRVRDASIYASKKYRSSFYS